MKISVTILLVALVSKGYSQLTCYQCQDCSEIGNNRKATKCEFTAETPPTIAPNTNTTTDPNTNTTDPNTNTTTTQHQATNNNTDYRCYTAQINSNGIVRLDRGCVEYKLNNTETCNTINNATFCTFCSANECNSATALITSAILILSALLVISLRLS